MALQDLYSTRYQGWNVRHFYGWYQREHAGSRSYSWVMDRMYGMPVLQEQKPVKNPIITCWQGAGLVRRAKTTGPHRRHREPSALPRMMIHQDGSTHQWIEGIYWDLIVTMEDATNEHYSMFFVEQAGTRSRFLGVRDVVETHGLFCSFYSDRGSHYWHTPEVGGERGTIFAGTTNKMGVRCWDSVFFVVPKKASQKSRRKQQTPLPILTPLTEGLPFSIFNKIVVIKTAAYLPPEY